MGHADKRTPQKESQGSRVGGPWRHDSRLLGVNLQIPCACVPHHPPAEDRTLPGTFRLIAADAGIAGRSFRPKWASARAKRAVGAVTKDPGSGPVVALVPPAG